MKRAPGIAGRIAATFINSRLTPLIVVGSLALGVGAVLLIPREEEPQIVVPMLDVTTAMPGASPQEIEQRVTVPVEKLLREIPGVEYVYSTSSPGSSLVIARFFVGVPQDQALVRVYSKLYSNMDRLPQGASQPMVKERSIDDVPILALTLWGKDFDAYHLRLIANELEYSFKQTQDVSETAVIGGQARSVQVTLSAAKLSAYGLTTSGILGALQAANARLQAGEFAANNGQIRLEAGNFFERQTDLENVVVGVDHGRPILLKDAADHIVDGPSEPTSYVLFGSGAGSTKPGIQVGGDYPAVTITIAKRKGANATDVANAVLGRLMELRRTTIPGDLNITVTRNYGETAKAKSDELLKHLLLATLSVTLLIALFLGWRESGVVLVAIPVTLALTLGVFYLYGFTLNRVTLFALIFSI